MNKQQKQAISRLGMVLMTLAVAILMVNAGCESRVIKAEGIGADESYPDRAEPSGDPSLKEFFFGGGSSRDR